MFRKGWNFIGLYAVLALAALPLVMEWVPPNPYFGFRLPGTEKFTSLWYDLNARGGMMFILSMAICAGLNAVLQLRAFARIHPHMGWINGALILLSFWFVSQILVSELG